MESKEFIINKYGTRRVSKDGKLKTVIIPNFSNDRWIEAMQEFKNNWIKVEDELPEIGKYDWVLVIAKMIPEGWYGVPAVAELRNNNTWFFRDLDEPVEQTLSIKVTHWMPLPDSP